ncbi:MAG TPA: glycosyltransferase family 2 protein [Candidatus Eisenbacteria bacterium]|nr:glycosyltransferase family 2 protein [Candidatus Eisenbacteria bacterium]
MPDQPPSGSPELSAVVPVYDEAEALPPLAAELESALRATGRPWEIVLVDDGSRDGTADWIADAARTRPGYVAVLLERNAGQSAALAAGFAAARGAIVVTLDADGQNDPADIPRLLEALRDADVVSGIRRKRADSFVRRASSRLANGTRRLVLGDRVTDIGCSMKAYRREALDSLPLFVGMHRFLPALCAFRGARLVEIPVAHRPRALGRSKYGVGNRLFRGLRDLFGVAWLRSRLLRHRVREVIRHVD